jgi:cytochrome c oxidase cbb3-type subunit 3
MSEKRRDDVTGQTTTGHSYDGIEELNTPLPRWWLWTFYLTILWGIGYTIAYPAWPMISGATAGLMGYSTRAEVAREIARHEEQNAALAGDLVATALPDVAAGGDLKRYAVARGGSVFRAQCSQCHGAGAAGGPGYPNLLDNDWLWGGSVDSIAKTVAHGVRNETDAEAHWSEMPAFGEILEKQEIATLADHVIGLSASGGTPAGTQAGGALFADNCASCHGDVGEGNREMGAPNLADAIWLYGAEREDVIESITNARFGVMPAWGQRLSEADIRAVSVYVHSLGGGE